MKKFIIAPLLVITFPVMAADNEVDNILVEKSARKMYLRHGNKNIKEYKIRLGSNPVGHKEQKGDGRTPEGKYTISGRNPKSAYHLALRISYPNAAEICRSIKILPPLFRGGNLNCIFMMLEEFCSCRLRLLRFLRLLL